MPKVDVKFTDNSEEVLAAMKRQVILGLKACGQEAEGYAKDECPVGTPESTGIPGYVGGTLRNSISNEVVESEQAVYIGTNVEYAPYVEYGEKARHHTGKAHFLRDAATTHGDRYKEIMEAALKDGE